jgi:hypothetical protein
MLSAEKFLSEVEDYLEMHNMAPTRFSTEVMKAPAFVARLREGVSPTARTMDKVRKWMEENG